MILVLDDSSNERVRLLEPRPGTPLVGADHDGDDRPQDAVEDQLPLQEGVQVLHLLKNNLEEEVDISAGPV